MHVREVGSPGWRWALAFRDWLRAEPDECRAYAAMKADVAAGLTATADYAAAKEPWFDAAAERLAAWTATTAWRPDLPR